MVRCLLFFKKNKTMKKTLIYLIAASSCILNACNNNPDSGQKQEQTTTVDNDNGTLDIKNAKTLEANKIPAYRFLTAQGDSSKNVAVIDMAANATCTGMPLTIGDLNSGTEFNIYRFDQSMSASATAMGFSGSIGSKEMLFIQDYIRYAEVDCGGVTKKYGIGLRCFIHVTSVKGGVSGGLSGIAASVELSRAKATFNIKSLGFGIDGSIIANGLSANRDYNVENFSKLAIIYNEILKTLNAGATKQIRPVELP